MRTVLVAAIAAAGLAAAGCSGASAHPAQSSGSPAAAAPAQGGAALQWKPCPQVAQRLQCSKLQVPLDYQRPGGRKITLALSEVPATAPAARRQGVLLVNPGGPGGSGLSLAADVAQGLSPAVASEYDIVGFDPRGVGSSVPALSCEPSFFNGPRPDYIAASRAAEQVLENRAKGYAEACEKKFGWLLPYMTTEDVARDLDSIRAALGQRQISYFAYSYGTYIGQVYATLFPSRIRRMVLDSTVDPAGVWYADNIGQDYAFQGRLQAFFAWAAEYDDDFRLGSTAAQVSRSFYRARGDLQAKPADGDIGPDEFDDTFVVGGYTNQIWPDLASALSSYLTAGSPAQLADLYQQEGKQGENEFAVYNAVECSDVSWPRNWARWDADTRKVYATAPFEAWDNTWFNAACAYWPVRGPARPLPIRGAGLPGILMLQGTLDAATPYAGAQQAHRLLPSARMVVVVGGGNHGQSLADPPNTCVDGYLNRYLATGALPAGPGLVNATCPALPPPAG
ncbi:MAG: alpha/beta hydrolase [Streptosporangiaceae bacterium]|jgi:pimeloyl-ACP methyl ester carboxylesterase